LYQVAAEPVLTHTVEDTESLLERDDDINLHVDYGPRSPEEKEYDEDKVKFSQEHPAEAFRIRLKRKSMEESALEEAYKEKVGGCIFCLITFLHYASNCTCSLPEELEKGYEHTDRMRNSIMIILISIVIITICFELVCGW
jgi:hypothetical protein